MKKKTISTTLLIIVFVLVVSIAFTLQKYLYNLGVEPLTLTYQSLFWAFVSISIYTLFIEKKKLERLDRKTLIFTLLACLLFGIFGFPLRALGQQGTSAINAAILGLAQLVSLIPLGYLFLKERFSWAKGVLVVFSMIGFYLVVADGSKYTIQPGDIYILVSSVAFAVAIVFTKRALEGIHMYSYTVYRMLFTFLFSILGIFLIGRLNFVFHPISMLLGTFTTAGFLLQLKLFERLSVSSTSLLSISIAGLSIYFAVIFLGESITVFQIVGSIIIFFCTAMIQRVENRG
jgi:drug/metabolite transporter (DMT)-like permease